MEDFEQLDYYELLGVGRSASGDEIKRAYRQQMSRFHPDRFAGASPAEQNYASRRAQRINEAYRALSDFAERSAYNRSLGGGPAARPAPPPPPAAPRDHQAELYDQARDHLAAGRYVQAVATLRELQRLNPFYRDSAALLAQAEAAARPAAPSRQSPQPAPASAAPDPGRRRLLAGGIGALALLGAGVAGWALRRPTGGDPAAAGPTGVAGGVGVATAPPAATSAAVATTAAPPAPTDAPAPSATTAPTDAPAPSATAEPTATPAPPTATPVPPSPTAEVLAETGELIYDEDFAGPGGWPALTGAGWSVGSVGGAYQITAQPGYGYIWAYRTSPAGERYQIAVDVEISGGRAGLMLRFSESGRYLAFIIDPSAGRFRLEDRTGREATALLDEASPALVANGLNRLLARLDGDRLELRINGQLVADLSRPTPPPTQRYGFVAVAGEGEVVARFTSLAIRSL